MGRPIKRQDQEAVPESLNPGLHSCRLGSLWRKYLSWSPTRDKIQCLNMDVHFAPEQSIALVFRSRPPWVLEKAMLDLETIHLYFQLPLPNSFTLSWTWAIAMLGLFPHWAPWPWHQWHRWTPSQGNKQERQQVSSVAVWMPKTVPKRYGDIFNVWFVWIIFFGF